MYEVIKGMRYSHATVTRPTPFLSQPFWFQNAAEIIMTILQIIIHREENVFSHHCLHYNRIIRHRMSHFQALFSCRIRISYPPHRPQTVSPHRESVRHCDLYLDFDSEKYAANGVKQYTLFLRKKISYTVWVKHIEYFVSTMSSSSAPLY